MVRKSENYQDKIKFLLDENMPFSSIEMLRDNGFDVEHLRFTGLRGVADSKVAEYAKSKKAILITKDKEFGNPLSYPKNSHHGLIIIRLLYFFTGNQITNTLKSHLDEIKIYSLINKVTILELGRYRQKEL